MLDSLGHSETYRFALGLQTAIAKVLQGSSNLLSTLIVVNSAAIAKALQKSSNLLSTPIVVNPEAIAKALWESSKLLSTQIVVNPAAPSAFHFEFGNFDQFLNTLDGHTVHGIIMALLNR